MKNQDNRLDQAADLRRQAEEITRGRAVLSSKDLEPLSPEETRRLLHELRVHQIELETQNEELRLTQEKLEASRARYFDLYDLAPVGYCAISEKGLILEANLTAAKLLGVARGVLVNRPITSFILPEDQDVYYRHRKELFRTGEPQACEVRLVKKDGTSFWAGLEATAALAPDGAPVYRVVLSDITGRKLQDEEHELTARLVLLVNTPGNFRELVSALNASLQNWSGCEAVGIRLRAGDDYPYFETRGFPPTHVHEENHLCAYGPDGKILRDEAGNPVFECMCGDILRGRFDAAKPFFTAHGSFWSNNTTALLASTTEADRQARTRNRCNGEGYESVALVPLRTVHQVFGLLQFNDHRPDRFTPQLIGHFERMADSLAIALSRRQAEEALRESESRYHELFNNISSGVAIYEARENGADFVFKDFNRAGERIDGDKGEDLIGKSIFEVRPGIKDFGLLDVFKRVWETGIPEHFPVTRYKDARLSQWYENFVYKLPSGEIVAVFDDITDRKRAEEERDRLKAHLHQAQKVESLGRMAGAIAHQYNNLLTAVLGNLELAMDELPPGSSPQENIVMAIKASRRAAEISHLMLAYLGQGPDKRAPLDLPAVCREALPLLNASLPKKTRLKIEFPVPGPIVRADAVQMKQVLTNLVVNASEAMGDEKGDITVSMTVVPAIDIHASRFYPSAWEPKAETYACLSVTDTGGGMDPETMEKLFDPFFSTKFTGRGLGLPVVMGIVKAHEGAVTVESRPGQGANFRVFLPVTAEKLLQPGKAEPIESEIVEGRGLVLVVEDEDMVRNMARRMLKHIGYEVIEAADGVEAVEVFRQHQEQIRCVLLDLSMPLMDGWETLETVRSIQPNIAVILASGYDEARVRAGDHPEQPQVFLHKPYTSADLKEALAAALK